MKIDNPVLLGQSSGFGIPTSGNSGQVLTKVDGTNYNTQWSDVKAVTYPLSESSSVTWVNLGRWTTTQTGKVLNIKVLSHVGYNALSAQPQVTELYVSTSNNVSSQAGSSGNFFAAGNASIDAKLGTGDNVYAAPYYFRIVQVSNTQYDVYGYFASWAGGIFTATLHSSDTWVANGATVSAPSGNFITITPSAAGRVVSAPVTITGSGGTNPTKGTMRTDYATIVEHGDKWCTFTMNYNQITSGSAGSGDYLITLPGSYQFDTAVHPVYTSTGNSDAQLSYMILTNGVLKTFGSGFDSTVYAMPYSATQFRLYNDDGNRWKSDWYGIGNSYCMAYTTFLFKRA
jgi:hypothetical protein